MKAYQKRQRQYNEQLGIPYVELTVSLGRAPKYRCTDNYGNYIAGGNTLEELDFAVSRFFQL